jgi:hypothetical protein
MKGVNQISEHQQSMSPRLFRRVFLTPPALLVVADSIYPKLNLRFETVICNLFFLFCLCIVEAIAIDSSSFSSGGSEKPREVDLLFCASESPLSTLGQSFLKLAKDNYKN